MSVSGLASRNIPRAVRPAEPLSRLNQRARARIVPATAVCRAGPRSAHPPGPRCRALIERRYHYQRWNGEFDLEPVRAKRRGQRLGYHDVRRPVSPGFRFDKFSPVTSTGKPGTGRQRALPGKFMQPAPARGRAFAPDVLAAG